MQANPHGNTVNGFTFKFCNYYNLVITKFIVVHYKTKGIAMTI